MLALVLVGNYLVSGLFYGLASEVSEAGGPWAEESSKDQMPWGLRGPRTHPTWCQTLPTKVGLGTSLPHSPGALSAPQLPWRGQAVRSPRCRLGHCPRCGRFGWNGPPVLSAVSVGRGDQTTVVSEPLLTTEGARGSHSVPRVVRPCLPAGSGLGGTESPALRGSAWERRHRGKRRLSLVALGFEKEPCGVGGTAADRWMAEETQNGHCPLRPPLCARARGAAGVTANPRAGFLSCGLPLRPGHVLLASSLQLSPPTDTPPRALVALLCLHQAGPCP